MTEPGARMSLVEHLGELRRRAIYALVALAVGAAAGYAIAPWLLTILSRPVGDLYFFTPAEAFIVRLKLSFVIGAVLAAPFIIFQAWRFLAPGLTARERGFVIPATVACSGLFLAGAAFAYFLILPTALRVLLAFGGGNIKPLLNLSQYLSFVMWLVLLAGLLFQTPAIIYLLAWLGIIDPRALQRKRAYAVVIIIIVAAVITPSVDVVSLVLVAGPLIVLYEISVWLARISSGRRRRAAPGADRSVPAAAARPPVRTRGRSRR